jgi:hypothetical protein
MRAFRVICLVAGLGMVTAATAEAQAGNRYVGISAGATWGDLHDFPLDTDGRLGGTAGLFAGIRPTRNTVVNVGTHWVQKGGGETRLDYLEIPITVGGVALIDDGLYRSRLYTGLALSVRMSCTAGAPIVSCSDAARTEWGWPIGLVVGRWSQGSTFFALDLRYTESLTGAFETVAISNRSWQIRLLTGWRIDDRE